MSLSKMSFGAMGFGAADRLHRSAEFLRLQRRGIRLQAKHFVLYAGRIDYTGEHAAGERESKAEASPRKRLGITVSRRVGNSVVRNRVKRHVRECFRQILRERLDDGMSIVVIALVGAGNLERTAINAELVTATLNLAGKRPRR
ncbi:MAG: ribonuclease P protein component [Candidatus Binataceae bacterium]